MYLIAGALTIVYLLWGIAALLDADTKENVPSGAGRMKALFYRMAALLVRGLEGKSFDPFENRSVKTRLQRLNPWGDIRALVRDYYTQKVSLILALLLAGTFLGCAVKTGSVLGGVQLLDNGIGRGSFEQADQEVQLELHTEDSSQTFQIKVHGQTPERTVADALEKEFWEKLSGEILGENDSFDAVCSDVFLPERLEGYPFGVEWESSRPDVVDTYGWVRALEDGEEEDVCLTATVKYGEWEWAHEVQLKVTARQKNEAQLLRQELEALLWETEEETRDQDRWELPREWKGKSLDWRIYREDNSLILWLMVLAASFLAFFLADKDLGDKVLEREQQMKDAYPSIVNKLILYLAAGMNVRSAICRISEDYVEGKKQGKAENPAYEELIYTVHELQAGVPEWTAYERLGKRSGLQEYVRFSALLIQNQKKGNYAFLSRLKEEAEHSRQEQLNRFRQKGELASTKLLFPMVMMLAVVMVMIMIPAFGDF